MFHADHLRLALRELRAALAHHEAERARWSARLDEIEDSLPNAGRIALLDRARVGKLTGEGADALYWCADRDMSTAARHAGALRREIEHLEAVLNALDDARVALHPDAEFDSTL